MYYFIVKARGSFEVLAVTHEGGTNARELAASLEGDYVSSWDFKTWETVIDVAEQATKLTGELFIPINRGPGYSPRFDVVRAPAIGDEASYGFNGDYYPCGHIVKISPTLKKIETDTGHVFYRRKQTAMWLNRGMWALVRGHIDERNPEF